VWLWLGLVGGRERDGWGAATFAGLCSDPGLEGGFRGGIMMGREGGEVCLRLYSLRRNECWGL
jgi:hypothetical protein